MKLANPFHTSRNKLVLCRSCRQPTESPRAGLIFGLDLVKYTCDLARCSRVFLHDIANE